MKLLQANTSTAAKRDFVTLPPTIVDRVTFKTSTEGELDHQWPGMFRGVPLGDIESADGFGRSLDLRRSLVTGDHKAIGQRYLCDFSTVAASTAGRACFDI
jgi:hypothetical protein